MTEPTGNCKNCGDPLYSERSEFCRGKCRSEYHAKREPVATIGGVRALKNGRVRVLLHFDGVEVSHFLKPEFLPGNFAQLLPKDLKE